MRLGKSTRSASSVTHCPSFETAVAERPSLTRARPPSLSPDRAGIVDVGAVEQLQEGLIRALRALITRRRPDDGTLFPKLLLRLPDLRTLNNLHSDKLLAFRIDP